MAKSGVKRQTLTKWTNPKFDGYPDLETLAQVARALEITTAEIVAAMDGDPSALPLDAATEALIRRVVEQVLDERQGPR